MPPAEIQPQTSPPRPTMPALVPAYLVQLELHKPSGRRMIRLDNLHVHTEAPHCEVEKDALHVEVDLFRSQELADIRKIDDDFRAFLEENADQAPSLKRGTYLIPRASWPMIQQEWRSFCTRRQRQVDLFLEVYARGDGPNRFLHRIGSGDEKAHFKEVFSELLHQHPDFERALDEYEDGHELAGKPQIVTNRPLPTADKLRSSFSVALEIKEEVFLTVEEAEHGVH